MEISKITNIVSVGLLTLISIFITLSVTYNFIFRNPFNIPLFLTYWIFSIILIVYLIFIVRKRFDSSGWTKSSMALNLIGIIFFIIVWSFGKMGDAKSSMILTYWIALPGYAIFLTMGFILLIIGVMKSKKGN
jgi:hypothetical protein